MNQMQQAAIITQLADSLVQQGSWCGETHLQKAMYLLQTLLKVPCEYEFIFYKFGPFSFDLRAELTALQADGLMELRTRNPAYGPSLLPTSRSTEFRQNYLVTLGKYGEAVAFVAKVVGSKGVADLERLATALYVSCEGGKGASVAQRAQRLNELKPHVPLPLAQEGIQEIDRITQEAAAKFQG
jgi:uncharacterized protein YwgA